MADENGSGGNGFLYFIVGALVVAVVGFGIYYFTQMGGSGEPDLSISVTEEGIEVDGN